MEIVKNNIGDLNATITVKIVKSDYEPEVEKQLKKARQKAELKGFRPGMAPMSIIRKMFGKSILADELDRIVSEAFNKFVEKEGNRLIGEPILCSNEKIYRESDDFEFVYEAGYYPELDLNLDKCSEIPYYKIIFDASETDEKIDGLQYYHGKLENIDAITDAEDRIEAVVIDFPKKNDGEQKKAVFWVDMISEDQQETVLGLKVGDIKELEIRKVFSDEIDLCNMLEIRKEELENIPQTLTFHIDSTSRFKKAEQDQEFFDKICDDYKTGRIIHNEQDLREYIENRIKEEYKEMSRNRFAVDARTILLKKTNLDMPEEFVKRWLMYINKENQKVTEESIDKEMPKILDDLRWIYIMNTLLEKDGIKISPEEIEQKVQTTVEDLVRQYKLDYDRAQIDNLVEHTLQSKSGLDRIVKKIKTDKIINLLMDQAKPDEKEISSEEYRKTLACDNDDEFEDEEYDGENTEKNENLDE